MRGTMTHKTFSAESHVKGGRRINFTWHVCTLFGLFQDSKNRAGDVRINHRGWGKTGGFRHKLSHWIRHQIQIPAHFTCHFGSAIVSKTFLPSPRPQLTRHQKLAIRRRNTKKSRKVSHVRDLQLTLRNWSAAYVREQQPERVLERDKVFVASINQ